MHPQMVVGGVGLIALSFTLTWGGFTLASLGVIGLTSDGLVARCCSSFSGLGTGGVGVVSLKSPFKVLLRGFRCSLTQVIIKGGTYPLLRHSGTPPLLKGA